MLVRKALQKEELLTKMTHTAIMGRAEDGHHPLFDIREDLVAVYVGRMDPSSLPKTRLLEAKRAFYVMVAIGTDQFCGIVFPLYLPFWPGLVPKIWWRSRSCDSGFDIWAKQSTTPIIADALH